MTRHFRNKDIFHDFTTIEGEEIRFTPRTFLEALDDAADEMNYSNYLTDKFERIQEIVRRYSEEHNIPLGLSRKQYQVIKDRKHAAKIKSLEELSKAMEKASSKWREFNRKVR